MIGWSLARREIKSGGSEGAMYLFLWPTVFFVRWHIWMESDAPWKWLGDKEKQLNLWMQKFWNVEVSDGKED